MPATSSSRAGTSARNEIIEMLKADHRKAKQAFKDFAKLDLEQDARQCQAIVDQACRELMLHMRLEEECFYPAIREVLDDADQVDEAEVEHASAKSLIEQLRDGSPAHEKWSARFTVLGEYINHHLKEEESEMFPEVSSKQLDWQDLLEQMKARRQQLMQEELPQGAPRGGEENDEQALRGGAQEAPPSRSATSRPRGTGARAQAASDMDEQE